MKSVKFDYRVLVQFVKGMNGYFTWQDILFHFFVPLFILDKRISYKIWSLQRSSNGPPHGCSVTAGGNRRIPKKPAMLGTVKQDNTILTCDQGCFNQIRARSRNRTLVTVVRDTCTTTVPPEEGIRRIHRIGELLYDTFKITVANFYVQTLFETFLVILLYIQNVIWGSACHTRTNFWFF